MVRLQQGSELCRPSNHFDDACQSVLLSVKIGSRTQQYQAINPLALLGYFNQRTNGPVNAHLRPEIYTCTNKLVRLEWYNACT